MESRWFNGSCTKVQKNQSLIVPAQFCLKLFIHSLSWDSADFEHHRHICWYHTRKFNLIAMIQGLQIVSPTHIETCDNRHQLIVLKVSKVVPAHLTCRFWTFYCVVNEWREWLIAFADYAIDRVSLCWDSSIKFVNFLRQKFFLPWTF